ncbi:C6 transcription factor [Phlyctema vagabunda]|uniref:C6 transcription factor n=1 Tax=Phlyctema vagabunda TaxID=108571 RepID=A0ABR4P9G1_9HELO
MIRLEVLNDIKERMAKLEHSVEILTASASATASTPVENKTRKRGSDQIVAQHEDKEFSSSKRKRAQIAIEPDSGGTPYSAHEGQILIQRELVRKPGLSKEKLDIFHSALSSLKNSLDVSTRKDEEAEPDAISQELINNPMVPELSLIQYMVQSEDSGRSVCAGNAFMPFTSRKTIARMVRNVMAKDSPPRHLPSWICVTSYAAYYIQEIMLMNCDKATGMEDRLQEQAVQLFATARALTSELVKQGASTNLETLQAMTYGYMLAQEAGDCATSWELIGIASKICIALELNKNVSCLSGCPSDVAYEAYCCFAVCYMNDKGTAMNCGRLPCLPDAVIEFDILNPPPPAVVNLDNFRIYLELARIQNLIVTELRSEASKPRQLDILARISAKLDQTRRSIEMIKRRSRETPPGKYDTDIDSTLVEFAFHSIKSVAFHTVSDHLQNPQTRQLGLIAARSALYNIQKARELARVSRFSTTYMKNSFAQWTILYYPFTPFFVLFCNVISTHSKADYRRMKQFIDYLAEVKHIIDKASKLHKLCLPFCSLAAGVINSSTGTDEDESYLDDFNEDNSLRQRVQQNQLFQERHSQPPQPFQIDQTLSATYQNLPIAYPHGSQQPAGYAPDTSINSGYGYQNPEYLWDFMETQPMLQWLESDFTAFEEAWAPIGNLFPPP